MTVPIQERIVGLVEVLELRVREAIAIQRMLRERAQAVRPLTEAGYVYLLARQTECAVLVDALQERLEQVGTLIEGMNRGTIDEGTVAQIIDLDSHRKD